MPLIFAFIFFRRFNITPASHADICHFRAATGRQRHCRPRFETCFAALLAFRYAFAAFASAAPRQRFFALRRRFAAATVRHAKDAPPLDPFCFIFARLFSLLTPAAAHISLLFSRLPPPDSISLRMLIC